jgi:hypothetical protein
LAARFPPRFEGAGADQMVAIGQGLLLKGKFGEIFLKAGAGQGCCPRRAAC